MLDRGIQEIGSVSLCIADGPDGWLEAWRHNEWGFFANPETAWARVPRDQYADFRLYAYALYPFEFRDGGGEPMQLDLPHVTPLGPEYVQVGWDAVSRSGGQHFECSPLSCNLVARKVTANRYCLFSDIGAARDFARTAEEDGCEPGPYHVLEVWRRQVSGGESVTEGSDSDPDHLRAEGDHPPGS